ncbi:MAG: hypothetical protein AAGA62_02600 [Bacteroidota bacterium]
MMHHNFKLSHKGIFMGPHPLRLRGKGQSLRSFLLSLLDEFYTGQDYRFNVVDDLGLACLATTAVCLHHHPHWQHIAPDQRALVLATKNGSLLTDLTYQQGLDHGGRTSPRTFVQTLPNMAAGQVAACFMIRGEHFVLVQSGPKEQAIAETVTTCLTYGPAAACLTGWVELTDEEALKVELYIVYAEAKDQAVDKVPLLAINARS